MFRIILAVLIVFSMTSVNAYQCQIRHLWTQVLNGIWYGPHFSKQNKIYMIAAEDNEGSTLEVMDTLTRPLLEVNIPGLLAQAPIMDDEGRIYIGNDDKSFLALNKKGKVRWNFITRDIPLSQPLLSPNNRIYYSTFSMLYSLSTEGKEFWHYTFPKGVSLNHLTNGINNDIYAYNKTDHNSIYAFNEAGEVKWIFHKGETLTHLSWPAVDLKNKRIYVVDHNALYALDANGKEVWQLPLETYSEYYGPFYAPTVGPDGTVYLDGREDHNHYAYAISPEGKIKWKAKLGKGWVEDSFELTTPPFFTAAGDVVFVSTDSRLENDHINIMSPAGERLCEPIDLPDSQLSLTYKDDVLYFSHHAAGYVAAYQLL